MFSVIEQLFVLIHQLIDVDTFILYLDKGEIKSAACSNLIFVSA